MTYCPATESRTNKARHQGMHSHLAYDIGPLMSEGLNYEIGLRAAVRQSGVVPLLEICPVWLCLMIASHSRCKSWDGPLVDVIWWCRIKRIRGLVGALACAIQHRSLSMQWVPRGGQIGSNNDTGKWRLPKSIKYQPEGGRGTPAIATARTHPCEQEMWLPQGHLVGLRISRRH